MDEQLIEWAGLVKLEGYSDSYDLDRLARVKFDTSCFPIVQFVSTLEPITKPTFHIIALLMQHYLRSSPLIIFGWSDSHRLAEELVSSNYLEDPPIAILSIKGNAPVDEDKLSESLLAFYELRLRTRESDPVWETSWAAGSLGIDTSLSRST